LHNPDFVVFWSTKDGVNPILFVLQLPFLTIGAAGSGTANDEP
jgi:hypothetical protein